MSLRQITKRLPVITDNGDGTVRVRIRKTYWTANIDEPLFDLAHADEATIFAAKIFLMSKGIRTWGDLLSNSTALLAYNDPTNKIWVDD